MSFVKHCRLSFKRAPADNGSEVLGPVQSIVLENRNTDGVLLFESGAIVKLCPKDFFPRSSQYTRLAEAYACLGVLTPPLPPTADSNISAPLSYLVIVNGCTLVGKISNYEVYRITGVQLVCLSTGSVEEESLTDVRKLLSSGAFYFARNSDTGAPYNLTVNVQNRHRLKDDMVDPDNIYLRTDVGLQFLWNRGLMTPLLRWGLNPNDWLVSIICGSFDIYTVYCGAEQARVGLVSRVSSLRPGTRFHSRGVNDNGDVANFVETEMFIYMKNSIVSHVQLRGTVPLFWEQPGIQVGSHKIHFSRGIDLSVGAFERHFLSIISQYGSTAIVNLLGCKQGEASLSRTYQELHKRSSFRDSIAQIVFDYHTELQTRGQKGQEWLITQLDRFVGPWGFFFLENTEVQNTQCGVLRVNCVDCLDRTNAVQTWVSLNLMLPRMLESLKLSGKSQQILLARFADGLRQLWQQNGDQVSRIYAGTGALGAGRSRLRDVQRTAVRTIQHSFFDSAKQEAMQTLLSCSSLQGWMKIITEQYLPQRLQYLPPTLLSNIMSQYKEFTQVHNLRVFVGTWNVNGGKHFRSVAHKHESVTDWLLDLAKSVNLEENWGYKNPIYEDEQINRPMDIFAIGFEEIVDLTTSNIVAGSKPSANQRDWGLFIQRHLNRDVNERDSYLLITSVQLVGVCLYLFVRTRLAVYLRDIATSSVKTGLGGTAGNKGGVAVRFQLGATSICFVCSHFAAGQSAVRERNEDFQEICRRLTFSSGHNILSHDYVFWCGDFNYRINLPGSEVKRLVSQSGWLDLLRSDQLTQERQAGNVFRGFDEGMIRFAPTYKYDLFCDDYDTSEKARSPAWTDRVLWRRVRLSFPRTDENGLLSVQPESPNHSWNPGRLIIYNRSELKTSDHRPVAAIFDIDVNVISRDARRKVVLEAIRDYGPVDACVQVKIQMYEAVSKRLVPKECIPPTLYRCVDFLDNLKAIGGLKHGSVLVIHFLDLDTALLTYENSKQAAVAVSVLDGYVSPWSFPIGLENIDGGYELHFSACLYASDGILDLADDSWSNELQKLVEISERVDAACQGSSISADVFVPLPVDRTSVGRAKLEQQPPDATRPRIAAELVHGGDLVEADPAKIADRKLPPRPAPPVRLGLITVLNNASPNAGETQAATSNGELQRETIVGDTPGVDTNKRQARYFSASATGSPTHDPKSGLPSVLSPGLLLPSELSPIQPVSSCVDLLAMSDIGESVVDRAASSADLMGLTFTNPPNDTPLSMPAEEIANKNRLPPPIPPRPPPFVQLPPVPLAEANQVLSKQDPFSLVDENTLSHASLTPTVDSSAPLINLSPPIPSRQAPPPPVPPAIPPRPKPVE
ncbi:unnamed protein product [Calicophoron daubneyi]|uniref:phosphoinositide 5-phosphatase n=1 Tax=Calicophoron daubneyi TaxID=300641 RepID=A0AAV2TQY2_CALDB